jgi:hypothetical protein
MGRPVQVDRDRSGADALAQFDRGGGAEDTDRHDQPLLQPDERQRIRHVVPAETGPLVP